MSVEEEQVGGLWLRSATIIDDGQRPGVAIGPEYVSKQPEGSARLDLTAIDRRAGTLEQAAVGTATIRGKCKLAR